MKMPDALTSSGSESVKNQTSPPNKNNITFNYSDI